MEGSRSKGFSKPKMENQFMLYNEDIYTEQWGHKIGLAIWLKEFTPPPWLAFLPPLQL
jgi:hypothetical protein